MEISIRSVQAFRERTIKETENAERYELITIIWQLKHSSPRWWRRLVVDMRPASRPLPPLPEELEFAFPSIPSFSGLTDALQQLDRAIFGALKAIFRRRFESGDATRRTGG
jgi:hypothetical protein